MPASKLVPGHILHRAAHPLPYRLSRSAVERPVLALSPGRFGRDYAPRSLGELFDQNTCRAESDNENDRRPFHPGVQTLSRREVPEMKQPDYSQEFGSRSKHGDR